MSEKHVKAATEIEVGTGSVFTQLGLPNPDERFRKARLMNVINSVAKRRGLSRKDAAQVMGLDQADVSRMQHGRGARYSTDRLLTVLDRLGVDVQIIQRHSEDGEIVIEVRELSNA